MQVVMSLVAGALFGVGLIVSGLANPAKGQNFLDIAGAWDPSLVFTMGSAVVITGVGYKQLFKRPHPIFGSVFHLPTASDIDGRLLSGAALFGIGWGLVGYCPGPAIVSLSRADRSTFIFVAAMLAGMMFARALPSPESLRAPQGSRHNSSGRAEEQS